MIPTAKQTVYKAFGLTLRSEIPLPELPESPTLQDGIADVSVEVSDLSEHWTRHAGGRKYTAADDKRVMFRIPDSAVYRIEGGNKITVSPLPGADEDEIRLYILGTCMGAVLLQRKQLPLHGSAVAVNGKAYAIVGESGAGKSTLASVFLDRGYPLLSDDVVAVSLCKPDPVPYVTPAFPQQKLWQESLAHFGMDESRYRPLFQRETKYSVPVQDRFHADPLPLAGVIELVKSGGPSVELERVERLERLSMLFRHTFRNMLIRPLGLMAWHLDLSARLAGRLEFYRLRRPAAGFTAPELATLILNTIRKDGERNDQK